LFNVLLKIGVPHGRKEGEVPGVVIVFKDLSAFLILIGLIYQRYEQRYLKIAVK